MHISYLLVFTSLCGLVSLVHPLYTVYDLKDNLELTIFDEKAFMICPEIIPHRDWPYLLFGDLLINIEYKATINLGPLEPSYKVQTNWTEQSYAKSTDHDDTDNTQSDSLIPNEIQSRAEEVILSNNSRAFFTLPLVPKTCFLVYDIKPNFHFGSLEIYSNREFDKSRLAQSLIGLLMLVCAESLANSIIFYYIIGVSIVLFSSMMLVIIVLIRMVPMRRTLAVLQSIVFLVSGTLGLTFVFIDYLRSAVVLAMFSKWEFVFGYVIVVSLCSFIILYWFQIPDRLVKNYPRTKIFTTLFFRLTGSLLLVYSVPLPSLNLLNFNSFTRFEHFLPFSGAFHILNKYPNMLMRFCLVIVVNILFSLMQRNCKYSPQKRHYNHIPNERHVNGFPLARQHYIPGPPWASSSPYNCATGFVGERDASYGFQSPFSNHNFVKSGHSEYIGYNQWTPEPFSVNRSQSYVLRRDSQHFHKNEILTDDED
ncbi:hypothetical protein MN116_005067 [Schistosoma mekongi]|uniref:Uncharacterized protein n=1 Tax=Schistosoma mekongi TaxID=38744 RepID=A0AAE1ZD34_SCHME|nr:hypothetical protein MN116_005067 [Schistosoma mekongi]